MNEILYPATPTNAELSKLRPSADFKKEVIRVSLAILLFLTVYLILIILAIGLAAGVSYLGINLIIFKPAFFTLLVGIGMIGMGVFVLFFLIKFIFAVKKTDRTSFYELKKNEYPDLHSFLKRLSKETKTKLPKRIYISPDVNASVFYDSSFLSMFFPVKKNLVIGLGLVNSVNMSEFKTIIAHEFGHFSQQSMSLGSYVYNLNKVIYNLLYENTGYASSLERWASASSYFAFFSNLTVKIVQGIQWVLQKLYVVVNKSNLSLSRQMEHHADAVSAYVSGSNHMFSALNRLQIGDSCYNLLIDNYNKWIPENLKPDNMCMHHAEVINHFIEDKELNASNGLPVVDSLYLSKIKQSRVVVKDQWASHPSTRERDDYIKSLGVNVTECLDVKPWILFNEPDTIQRKITNLLFSGVKYKQTPTILDVSTFKKKYFSEYHRNTFQKEYKGFYDGRRISELDLHNLISENHSKYKSFEEIYNNENCSLLDEKNILESDISILKEIKSNPKMYKTFDFRGKKYTSLEAETLLKDLETENSEINKRIQEIDIEAFKFFNKASTNNEVINHYKVYYDSAKLFERTVEIYNELYSQLYKVYNSKVQLIEAYAIIDTVKKYEKQFKAIINEVISEIKNEQYLNEEQTKKLDWYMSLDRDYVDNQGYKDGELTVLNESLEIFINIMAERQYKAKKKLLQIQLDTIIKN
jgi:Zn-dependent protease with chaperone function